MSETMMVVLYGISAVMFIIYGLIGIITKKGIGVANAEQYTIESLKKYNKISGIVMLFIGLGLGICDFLAWQQILIKTNVLQYAYLVLLIPFYLLFFFSKKMLKKKDQ